VQYQLETLHYLKTKSSMVATIIMMMQTTVTGTATATVLDVITMATVVV